MRLMACVPLGLLVIVLAACGDEAEVDQAGLDEAQQEVERQERRRAQAEARLEAVREGVGQEAPGAATSDPGALASEFETYTSTSAGWSADVPVGSGWGEGVESEITPGRLFRTQFAGPQGAILIIDSTPFDAPSFSGAPVDSRMSVDHPTFGTMEKIIFQGNSRVELCETGLCVDYLIPYQDGGYAVLAGGPDITETEALAERVAMSLRYYDY